MTPAERQTDVDTRQAFEAWVDAAPDWSPEFEKHRPWVLQFAEWAWQAATLAERERCAKVCEGLKVGSPSYFEIDEGIDLCAAAIRAG